MVVGYGDLRVVRTKGNRQRKPQEEEKEECGYRCVCVCLIGHQGEKGEIFSVCFQIGQRKKMGFAIGPKNH